MRRGGGSKGWCRCGSSAGALCKKHVSGSGVASSQRVAEPQHAQRAPSALALPRHTVFTASRCEGLASSDRWMRLPADRSKERKKGRQGIRQWCCSC